MTVLDFGGHCHQLLFYTACFRIVIHDLAQNLLLTLFTPRLQLHEQPLRCMDGSPLQHITHTLSYLSCLLLTHLG